MGTQSHLAPCLPLVVSTVRLLLVPRGRARVPIRVIRVLVETHKCQSKPLLSQILCCPRLLLRVRLWIVCANANARHYNEVTS
ncbi:hypothetical protein F4801DRAFT_545390 [Xylaria longipes]|nr:hypothetical protein F4801DRAFT_545390 [Xylaria longipes]